MKSEIRSAIVLGVKGVLLSAKPNNIENDDGTVTKMTKFSFKVDAYVAELDKTLNFADMPDRCNWPLYVMNDDTETIDLLTSIPAQTPHLFLVTPSGKTNGRRDVSGVKFEVLSATPI